MLPHAAEVSSTAAVEPYTAERQAPLSPAGVKRISGGVYQEMRQALVAFLRAAIPDAIALAEHCRRCTVTVNDILLALKRRGM